MSGMLQKHVAEEVLYGARESHRAIVTILPHFIVPCQVRKELLHPGKGRCIGEYPVTLQAGCVIETEIVILQ